MTQEQRREHEAFLEVSGGFEDDSGGYEGDVLRGTMAAEISHAGEAIQDPEEDRADEDLLEMLREQQRYALQLIVAAQFLLNLFFFQVKYSLVDREIVERVPTERKSSWTPLLRSSKA
jgi:hypothetical protein